MIIAVCDMLMLLVCTFVVSVSYKRMFRGCATALIDLVIIVVYMFMCLPIIFNYLVGIPEYSTAYWYKVFLPGMEDELTVFLYDFYVAFIVLCLHFYGTSKAKSSSSKACRLEINEWRWLLFIGVILPFFLILVTGKINNYTVYADSLARGLDDSFVFIINCSLFLSLFCFTLLYFSIHSRSKSHLILLVLYTALISWISGKRFIIALALMMYLFAFLSTEDNTDKRTRLYRTLPLLFIALVSFSGFYMTFIKPLTNTINYDVYEMLRVDFGRDDVTKYVIYQTTVLGNKIVEYPGQTILSFLFFFVPRKLWPSKPFQHYQYLTSSILSVPISEIPAGTTPSGFEMFFANFGLLGIPLFAVALLGFISLFDSKNSSVPLRLLGLTLCLVLLTQSIDVYLVYVLLAMVLLIKRTFRNRLLTSTDNTIGGSLSDVE